MGTGSNQLKYQADINVYAPTNCPPDNAISKKTEAFRFVHNPGIEQDFQNHIQRGILPRATRKDADKCSCCGLSFFLKQKDAIDTYNRIMQLPARKNFTFTHLSKGLIAKEDGVCTESSDGGHFDLHEFTGVDLSKRFTIVCRL